MKKVVKFGGSSLASAEQFVKVGNIIRADKERSYVVPSAPGKRFSNDTKVTDMLYGCYALAEKARILKRNWMQLRKDIRKLLTDFIWSFHWIKNFRLSKRILKEKQATITLLPAENI